MNQERKLSTSDIAAISDRSEPRAVAIDDSGRVEDRPRSTEEAPRKAVEAADTRSGA